MEHIMKKILTTLACGAILATTASADFARVEMGGGLWSQSPSGDMSYTNNGVVQGQYDSDKKDNSNAYIWMYIKHPIPIVPNLRLEYTGVKDSGVIQGNFKDFNLPITSPTTTGSIEMTQYDVIPYYNILDNTFWMTIDLGVDIKILDTTFKAEGVKLNGSSIVSDYEDKTNLALPLAYARARVEIPGTDIGLEADGKYISYDGSTIYDACAKVDYTLDFIPVIQPGVEVGYRTQKFDLKYKDGADETKVNLSFSGFYAGLMLRF